jgi:hypothetical protein
MSPARAKPKPKPKARAAPARRPAPGLAASWRDLRLALVLAIPVLGVAFASRPVPPPKEVRQEAFANVQVPEADRSRINSWPKFFACYNLTSPRDIMAATLEGAGFAQHPQWRPDALIRVPLAPARTTPTSAEQAVMLEAVSLAQQRATGGSDPCR